mgnify:FL=1|jgi:uncharacterized membrane protein|tara:strand:- start:2686 stop:3198 length:513 start_codon:yes stop_codon:yes gene_type:complete
MKTIRVILIIISIFVLGFLATGLVVRDTSYTAKVYIAEPIDAVFNNFIQMDSVKNWIPEIKSVEVLQNNIEVTGSVYKVVVLNQGQEIIMTKKIMAYVPNEKVTFFYDAENMLKKDDFIFSMEDGNTVITLNARCQSESFLMGCMFPYFKGTFRAQDQAYLENFKKYMEE